MIAPAEGPIVLCKKCEVRFDSGWSHCMTCPYCDSDEDTEVVEDEE